MPLDLFALARILPAEHGRLSLIAAKASPEGNAVWCEAQQALSALSSRSSLVVANTGHTAQIEEPDIVINAMRSVLNEVRERTSLQ